MSGKVTKTKELRLKTDKELETMLADLCREQFNLRFQRATGQLANTSRVAAVRMEIARIKTLLAERGRKASDGKASAA